LLDRAGGSRQAKEGGAIYALGELSFGKVLAERALQTRLAARTPPTR
jgi:hypothetical protein